MDTTTKNVLIGAGVWAVGIYLYQRSFGVIVASNGQTLIPGFLDPLGMLIGYPGQVDVGIVGTITTDYDSGSNA